LQSVRRTSTEAYITASVFGDKERSLIYNKRSPEPIPRKNNQGIRESCYVLLVSAYVTESTRIKDGRDNHKRMAEREVLLSLTLTTL